MSDTDDNKREVKFTVASGVKGQGKTYTTVFKFIIPYSRGLLNGGIPRKVLILDVNDEYGVLKPEPSDPDAMKITDGKPVIISPIEPKDIKLFSQQKQIEIRRLRPYHYRNFYNEKGKITRQAGELMGEQELLKLLNKVLTDFRGGLIVIEDLSTVVGNHVPGKVFTEITRNRHRGNDIITHVQSINVILPKFWDNIDYTRFHKQIVDVDRSADKLLDRYDVYKISQIMIDEEIDAGNNRYFVYIDNVHKKIIGAYTPEMLMNAIYKYIDLSSNILRSLVNERTEGGKKLRTYSQAREEKAEELFKKYSDL